MSFSEFLNSRRKAAKALVAELRKDFAYASILGADIKSKSVRVDRNTSNISTGRDTECGFVVKLSDGKLIYEYSLDDICGDIPALAQSITAAFRLNARLTDSAIGNLKLTDEPLVQSFCRPSDLGSFSDDQLLEACIQNRALCRRSDFLYLSQGQGYITHLYGACGASYILGHYLAVLRIRYSASLLPLKARDNRLTEAF
jgi:hypothetical protein